MKSYFEHLLKKTIRSYSLLEESSRENDVRRAYKIETPARTLCVKMHHNEFTTLKRVHAVALLVEKYNETGYYCPSYLPFFEGEYATESMLDDVKYVVWVEEFSLYQTTKKDALDASINFGKEKVRYLGKIATALKGYPFPYVSPYVMYESFDSWQDVDEYEEYFKKVYHLLDGLDEVNQSTLDYVKNFFYEWRNILKEDYSSLPSSVFQGDLQVENLLVKDNRIIGVLDFNLAGQEKVLSYFINETAYQETKPIGSLWIEEDYIKKHLHSFFDDLIEFQKHYQLSKREEKILWKLYKIIVPYKYYPLTEIIGYAKKNDYKEVNYRLAWMKKLLDYDIEHLYAEFQNNKSQ